MLDQIQQRRRKKKHESADEHTDEDHIRRSHATTIWATAQNPTLGFLYPRFHSNSARSTLKRESRALGFRFHQNAPSRIRVAAGAYFLWSTWLLSWRNFNLNWPERWWLRHRSSDDRLVPLSLTVGKEGPSASPLLGPYFALQPFFLDLRTSAYALWLLSGKRSLLELRDRRFPGRDHSVPYPPKGGPSANYSL